MKIAITGKGGVGKTTLASLLAHIYAQEGERVLAIDADLKGMAVFDAAPKVVEEARDIWQRLKKGEPTSTSVEG